MHCAYCGEERALTREHIWPSFMLKEIGDRLRYREGSKRLFYGDLVVKDVCESCNNGPLSKLDEYGKLLYDKYFSESNRNSPPVIFEYSYSMLARWLLKLSFNSARASHSNVKRLEVYRDALINHDVDIPNNFLIKLDLISPFRHGNKIIHSSSNRIARVNVPDIVEGWFTVRMVSINQFYFWLIFQDAPDCEIKNQIAREFLDLIPGVSVSPESGMILIEESGINTLDAHRSWAPALIAAGPPPKKRK